jgi:hypothetical protein
LAARYYYNFMSSAVAGEGKVFMDGCALLDMYDVIMTVFLNSSESVD